MTFSNPYKGKDLVRITNLFHQQASKFVSLVILLSVRLVDTLKQCVREGK